MTLRRRNGFTLVEILIVVVILGILASVVVPQLSNASGEAIRSALARQLQMINSQVELYRIAHQGVLPTENEDNPLVDGGVNNGWGAMISVEYLKEEPYNGYTRKTLLVAGDLATAAVEPRTSANGWYYEQIDSSLTIYAAGFNKITGQFAHEVVVEEE